MAFHSVLAGFITLTLRRENLPPIGEFVGNVFLVDYYCERGSAYCGPCYPWEEILDMTKQAEQTMRRKVGKQQSFITPRSVPASKFLPWTPGLTRFGDGVWLESCGINKSSLPKLLLVLVFVMATVILTEFVQIIIWLLCMVTDPFKSKTLTSFFSWHFVYLHDLVSFTGDPQGWACVTVWWCLRVYVFPSCALCFPGLTSAPSLPFSLFVSRASSQRAHREELNFSLLFMGRWL